MATPTTLVMGLNEDGAAPEILPGEVAKFEFAVGEDFEIHSIGLMPYEAERVSAVAIFPNFEVRWTGFMDGVHQVVLAHRLRAGDVVRMELENLSTEKVLRRVCLLGWWACNR